MAVFQSIAYQPPQLAIKDSVGWLAPPPARVEAHPCLGLEQLSGMRKDDLMLVKFYNLPVRFAKVNSIRAVASMNSSSSSLDDARFIDDDIKAIMSEVDPCKCLFVSKSGNVLGHNPALLAFSSAREFFWLDISPFCTSLPL
ncbi:hypothetical protein QYF36_006338 [Acer negundo]|nr:hypothetical protein QYF36_006338 [Acer negundo]